MATVTMSNPPSVRAPTGYTHGLVLQGVERRLIISGQIGMAQDDPTLGSARRERQRQQCFASLGRLGHPGLLDTEPAIERDEAAVMRPVPALVVDAMVEQAVDDGVHNRLRDAEPRTAWTLGVQPAIINLARRGADRMPEFDFHRYGFPTG